MSQVSIKSALLCIGTDRPYEKSSLPEVQPTHSYEKSQGCNSEGVPSCTSSLSILFASPAMGRITDLHVEKVLIRCEFWISQVRCCCSIVRIHQFLTTTATSCVISTFRSLWLLFLILCDLNANGSFRWLYIYKKIRLQTSRK